MTSGNVPRPTLKNRLLGLLPPDDFALIAAHLVDVEFKSGEVLYEPGERMEQIYFPSDGVISLVAVMADGTPIETATIGREGAIGLVAHREARIAFNRCVVQVPGFGHRIGADRFAALVDKEGVRDLCARYMEVLLAQSLQSVACNALHSVEARFCRWLLMCDDRTDADIVALTQEFLAEMLGVQRTTVTIVARTAQNAGLIRYHRGRIKVTDRAGLEAAACECYGTIRRHTERLLPQRTVSAAPTLAAK